MERNDKAAIEALLKRHGFHFSKSMGQNFLIDPAIPYEIAESSRANEQNGVLEIGPGIGALSHELCERAGKVVAVELDRALLPVLAETMAPYPNVEVVPGDVLKLDLTAIAAEKFQGLTPIVCANLPYSVTSPLLAAFIEARCFERITVMIQREVALRICAAPGSSDYGAFSVFCQYHTQPELLFEVGPECFLPAPKVTSAVIHCRSRKAPPVEVCSREMLFRTVRAGFALRRKTLVNSLQTAFPLPKERLTEIVAACGLDPSVRGERLGLAEYARLADALAAEKEG